MKGNTQDVFGFAWLKQNIDDKIRSLGVRDFDSKKLLRTFIPVRGRSTGRDGDRKELPLKLGVDDSTTHFAPEVSNNIRRIFVFHDVPLKIF